MKIAVTCGRTSQGFLPPIEKLLREGGHEVQRFDGTSGRDIVARVTEWGARAIWHEWADAIGAVISALWQKPMIVRCHRYDVNTPAFAQIKWGGMCIPIITSHHVIERALNAASLCGPIFIPSIVDFEQFQPAVRVRDEDDKTIRVAVVGYFNGRKQPALALEAIRRLAKDWLVDVDFVGQNDAAEPWWEDWFRTQPTRGFMASVSPWTNDVQAIWRRSDVCLSASSDEGCPYNVIEAMASGAQAFVHHYPGAEAQFPEEFLWRTLDELVAKWEGSGADWTPEQIRAWAAAKYSIEANRDAVLNLFK